MVFLTKAKWTRFYYLSHITKQIYNTKLPDSYFDHEKLPVQMEGAFYWQALLHKWNASLEDRFSDSGSANQDSTYGGKHLDFLY